MYRQLDSRSIHKTLARLKSRISERFPDSSLSEVAGELLTVEEEAIRTTENIARPIIWLRVVVWVLRMLVVAAIGMIPFKIHQLGIGNSWYDMVQVIEPSLGAAFFITAFLVYLGTVERRVKQARALSKIHELRSLAHVVDMHQLTKDPMVLLTEGPSTASSPARSMTAFELSRYLDYCSEILSLISKIAALYVQHLPDPVAVSAVDEIETLTSGLSRKIWQKIMLVRDVKFGNGE